MKTALTLLMSSAISLCAADMSVATLYNAQLRMAEGEIVSLAKAMPESAYNFAPTNGSFEKVRTFGQQAKHIAAVIYLAASAANQEKTPVDVGAEENGPANVKTKAEIVQFLEDAFTYGHKVMATLTAANQLDLVKAPFPGMPDTARAGIANLTIWHSFDHYGQMVVYARMNNVIPPASQPAPPRRGPTKK